MFSNDEAVSFVSKWESGDAKDDRAVRELCAEAQRRSEAIYPGTKVRNREP